MGVPLRKGISLTKSSFKELSLSKTKIRANPSSAIEMSVLWPASAQSLIMMFTCNLKSGALFTKSRGHRNNDDEDMCGLKRYFLLDKIQPEVFRPFQVLYLEAGTVYFDNNRRALVKLTFQFVNYSEPFYIMLLK